MNDPAAAGSPADAPAAYRVLVVDDDRDMADFLARLLQGEGLSVETAADGQSALMQVMAAPPDLVLLDVMMPGRSGFEICRQLKGDESTALIPIILVTALEDSESRVRGIEAGADDFLS
jgi:DNA-binding response OmpR family regulator